MCWNSRHRAEKALIRGSVVEFAKPFGKLIQKGENSKMGEPRKSKNIVFLHILATERALHSPSGAFLTILKRGVQGGRLPPLNLQNEVGSCCHAPYAVKPPYRVARVPFIVKSSICPPAPPLAAASTLSTLSNPVYRIFIPFLPPVKPHYNSMRVRPLRGGWPHSATVSKISEPQSPNQNHKKPIK